MRLSLFQLDLAELHTHANLAFAVGLAKLCNDGQITREQYDRWIKDYVIVVAKKGMFEHALDRLFSKVDSEIRYHGANVK